MLLFRKMTHNIIKSMMKVRKVTIAKFNSILFLRTLRRKEKVRSACKKNKLKA